MLNTDAILEAALFCPTSDGWGLPLCFMAEPGTGKSSKLKKIGRRFGWHVEVLSPSVRGMGAFGVVPVSEGEGTAMRIKNPCPEWADKLAFGGLLVVDEFTTATQEIQAAMLGLMCEKLIGAHELVGDVRVIALANPVAMAANGNEIAPPLANRVGWIDWTPPTGIEHAAYLASCAVVRRPKETTSDAGAIEAAVLAEWPSAMSDVAALCAGFHQAQPNWKNMMPKADDPQRGAAWPSDRTWEYAARSLAIAAISNRKRTKDASGQMLAEPVSATGLTPIGTTERHALVAGFVGAPAAAALFAYARDNALPPIADILDGTARFVHNPKRVDLTLTVLTGGVALVTPRDAENRTARATTLWELIEAIGGIHADFMDVFGNALINASAIGTSPASTRVLMALTAIKKVH